MKTTIEAWRCEYSECGHAWPAGEVQPEKCARCRRRGWHQTLTTGELIRQTPSSLDQRIREIVCEVLASQSEPVTRYNVPPNVPDDVPNVPALSMDDRRAAAYAAIAQVARSPLHLTTASAMMQPDAPTYERDEYSQ